MKKEAPMLSTRNYGPVNGMRSDVGIVYFRMSSLQNLKGPLLRFSNAVQTVIQFYEFFFRKNNKKKKKYVAGFVVFEITYCKLAIEAGIVFLC
jgi:hypothetical protein